MSIFRSNLKKLMVLVSIMASPSALYSMDSQKGTVDGQKGAMARLAPFSRHLHRMMNNVEATSPRPAITITVRGDLGAKPQIAGSNSNVSTSPISPATVTPTGIQISQPSSDLQAPKSSHQPSNPEIKIGQEGASFANEPHIYIDDFVQAARDGEIGMVVAMLPKIQHYQHGTNHKDQYGNSAIIAAHANGHDDVVKFLAAQPGIDPQELVLVSKSKTNIQDITINPRVQHRLHLGQKRNNSNQRSLKSPRKQSQNGMGAHAAHNRGKSIAAFTSLGMLEGIRDAQLAQQAETKSDREQHARVQSKGNKPVAKHHYQSSYWSQVASDLSLKSPRIGLSPRSNSGLVSARSNQGQSKADLNASGNSDSGKRKTEGQSNSGSSSGEGKADAEQKLHAEANLELDTLVQAIYDGKLKKVKRHADDLEVTMCGSIINNKGRINGKDELDWPIILHQSPLYTARAKGYKGIERFLVGQRLIKDPMKPIENFIKAAEDGDLQLIKVHTRDPQEVKALAEKLHLDLAKSSDLKKFDECFPKIEKMDAFSWKRDQNALHAAAFAGHDQVIKYLIDEKAKSASPEELVSFMDVAHPNEGRTALMIAAHAGHQAAMSTLMDHGANYTLPDVFGNTLLTVIENQDNVQTRNLMARKLQETAHKHAIVAATLKNPELAQELQTMAEQAKKLQQTKNTNKCVVQ